MDVKVSINGKDVMADNNSTIVETAAREGIRIPVLCYLKRLKPLGSCKVCAVEVQGVKNLLPACAAKPREGYKIITESEKISETRRNVISNLLLKHPLDCPVCDKSGDCLLQDLTFKFGITKQDNERTGLPKIRIFSNDFIEYNYDRCVLCSRCIRGCSDMYGAPFLKIVNDGTKKYVDVKQPEPISGAINEEGGGKSSDTADSGGKILNCYNCGNCVAVCPVGALISIPSKFREKIWQLYPFPSACNKCSAMCGIKYYRNPENESLARTGHSSCGYLCKEGFFYEGIGKNNGYYLKHPMLRVENNYREISYEESLSAFVGKIKDISTNGGLKSTAVLVSPSLSSYEGFFVGNFIRDVIKPTFFDISVSPFYRENFNFFKKIFPGEENFRIDNLLKTELIIYIGSIEEEIPFALYNIMKSKREKRTKFIVVDTGKKGKKTPGRFEDLSFIYTKIDSARINNFLRNIKDVIEKTRMNKIDEESAAAFCLEEDEMSICQALTKSPGVSIIIGDNAMAARLLDKEFATISKIARILRENERTAIVYPLIKPFNYRGIMNSGITSGDGSNYGAILESLQCGGIKNLIFIGELLNDGNSMEIAKYASGLDFLAVFSSRASILSSMADIVMPVKDYLEKKNESYENFEGRNIVVHNEFNFGGKRMLIKNILASIASGIGYSGEIIKSGFEEFKNKTSQSSAEYDKEGDVEDEGKFYYNFRGKLLY